MNTPTHAILSLALLGRRDRPQRSAPALIGAALPDLPIAVLYLVATFALGQPASQIWSETYFAPGWQLLVDLPHSFPLVLAGWIAASRAGHSWLTTLFASMFFHSLLDFPVHTDDAHRHFRPFSEWQFVSPVSYWDPAAHGRWVALAEIVAVLGVSPRVFTLLRGRVARSLLLFTAAVYVAGATVLLRPCLTLPWLGTLLTDDARCQDAHRRAPGAR